jgi:hypothetical protein
MFVEGESSRGMSPPPIGVPLTSVSLLTVGPGSVPVWWSSTPGVAEPRPNVGPLPQSGCRGSGRRGSSRCRDVWNRTSVCPNNTLRY